MVNDGDDDIQDVEGEVCNTMTSSAVHKDGGDDDDDWNDDVSWTPTSGRTCNAVRLWTSTSSLSGSQKGCCKEDLRPNRPRILCTTMEDTSLNHKSNSELLV